MEVKGFVPTSSANEARVRNVLPKNIAVRLDGSCGKFGSAEIELAAGRLVVFLQLVTNWKQFCPTFLHRYYHGKGWDTDKIFLGLTGLSFNGAPVVGTWRGPALVALMPNGMCKVTDAFILLCMGEEPALPSPAYA